MFCIRSVFVDLSGVLIILLTTVCLFHMVWLIWKVSVGLCWEYLEVNPEIRKRYIFNEWNRMVYNLLRFSFFFFFFLTVNDLLLFLPFCCMSVSFVIISCNLEQAMQNMALCDYILVRWHLCIVWAGDSWQI